MLTTHTLPNSFNATTDLDGCEQVECSGLKSIDQMAHKLLFVGVGAGVLVVILCVVFQIRRFCKRRAEKRRAVYTEDENTATQKLDPAKARKRRKKKRRKRQMAKDRQRDRRDRPDSDPFGSDSSGTEAEPDVAGSQGSWN